MDSFRLLKVTLGGLLIVLLADCSQNDPVVESNSPLQNEQLKYLASESGSRTASGIDLDTLKCSYMWSIATKSFLDICIPDGDKELKEDLNDEVTRIAEFLVKNSSEPDVTRQRLELDTRTLQTGTETFRRPKMGQICSEMGSGQKGEGPVLRALRELSREQRRTAVDKLLTEPSPSLQMCTP